MAEALESPTSKTLLGRLRHDPTDQDAWEEFVLRYGPRVHAWCCAWGLKHAEAQDVTQDVFVILARRMRQFEYDAGGSFRGWLRQVSRNAVNDYFSTWHKGGEDAVARLEGVEARDDLERRLAEEYDLELLERAFAKVQLLVERNTWEAFRLTALEGLKPAEVGPRLGMTVSMVHVAKKRVKDRVKKLVEKMDQSGE